MKIRNLIQAKVFRICVYLLISFYILCKEGHTQNFTFDKITTREGLSQNDINDIHQDQNGFLWIATHDGLNKYDGYKFKTYRIDPKKEGGISSNLIFDIDEDKEGNLWIGTSNAGVCKFNVKTEKFTVIKNTPETPNLLNSNLIKVIMASNDGSVWIGTKNGIDILKHVNGNYVIDKITPENTPEVVNFVVSNIKEDKYGRKWVGTIRGLYLFFEKDGKRTVKKISREAYVRDIYITDDDVFVSYQNGIARLNINSTDLTSLSDASISNLYANRIIVDEHRNILIGNNDGFFVAAKDPKAFNAYNKPEFFNQEWRSKSLSTRVTSLFQDKTGNIWVGTNGGGLTRFNSNRNKFRHFNKTNHPGSLSYNKIRSIYQDSEKNIWIGTEQGGVNLLLHNEHKNYESGFTQLDPNILGTEKRAYSFVELNTHNEQQILIGTGYPELTHLVQLKGNKLHVLEKGIFSQIKSEPFYSIKDRNGIIWLGTYGTKGLYKYVQNEKEEKILNYRVKHGRGSLSSNIIRSLLEDKHGNIWIGTDNGLNLLTSEQQTSIDPNFVVFKNEKGNPNSLSNNYILPIFQSKNGTIWVGTLGGGLNKMHYHPNPDSIKFEVITTEDGLPNNVIKGILEDDYGFLWISSNRGLSRYDVNDHLFSNYDINDGLQDYEFSELACCKLSDGEMLFGGVNGFNAFYPHEIFNDMSIPDLALTDFQVLNQSVVPGEQINGRVLLRNNINHTEHIRLKYSENSFAIYFAALHFSAPNKYKYKYILEGFNTEWIRKNADDRIAKYTNLPPGDYTFKVLASNNDGVWTDEAKVLPITITPPWYMSNTAWISYIFLLIVMLWIFGRYSLIRVNIKNKLMMEHFEAEKIKELSKMKLQFFTNISHEFRTPLSLILGPLEKLIKHGDSLPKKKITENYNLMHRNASILLRLINQLIDFRKFEQGKMKLRATNTNIISFLNDIYLSFYELAENKQINYIFSPPEEEIKIWFDDEKMERIMYNLLSNAFKFTHEGDTIELKVEELNSEVVIKVIDTGVGIPKAMQEHIFERFYQAERIENRKVGSTGIGLSFIKGLIEMHKGTISFESEENLGTTFTVILKKGDSHLNKEQMRSASSKVEAVVHDYSIPAPEQNTNIEIEEEVEEAKQEKPAVLVVEDNYELRSFLKDSLSNKYSVHLAENGKAGLEKVPELNPVVIISDVMMPVMDGFELCESVKKDEAISHIPIILLTAKSDADSRVKSYNLGADGYISKPFSLEVLEARIVNLIESREKLKEKLRTTISVEPSQVTTTSMDEKFLKRVLRIIEENISDSGFTVEQLANEYGMSQVIFHKKIKVLTGQTPKVFIRTIRLKRAAQLLAMGQYSVADISFEVGFIDVKYFSICFKNEFGMPPSEYSKKNKEQSQ